MNPIRIFRKPLSVNECWQGKRFKTKAYNQYESALLFILPKIIMPSPPFEIHFIFGFSSAASDYDNPIKPLQDILQKKYGFDDKLIYRAVIEREKVEKGKEFFQFQIINFKK